MLLPPLTASITRPANTTDYGAGDVIGQADATTAAEAGTAVLEFANAPSKGTIKSATLRVDIDAVPAGMAAMRLHLFKSAPTAILDNAAWGLPAGDRSAYLGYIELTPADLGATLWAQSDSQAKRISTVNGKLYGILQTVGGHTPPSAGVYDIVLNPEI
jgi:hypothetical protein